FVVVDCRSVAAGWRNRHHEHHARQRHRTHTRDWDSHGYRRKTRRYPFAVLDRSVDPRALWRTPGNWHSLLHRKSGRTLWRLARIHATFRHGSRLFLLSPDRRILWLLSCFQGQPTRSDRRPPPRIIICSGRTQCAPYREYSSRGESDSRPTNLTLLLQ